MWEDYLRIEGFNTLTARILDVKTFRIQYRKLLEEILDSKFNVDYMKPKIQALHELIKPYVQQDPYEKNHIDIFDKEPDYICNYIEARGAYIKGQLNSLE